MDRQLVPFFGDEIEAFWDEKTEEIRVGCRNVTRNMGLDWKSQHDKLREDVVLSERLGMVLITTPGGEQEVLTLPLDMLGLWFATIIPGRVKAPLRPKIIRYKKEAAAVLAQHFFGIAPRHDSGISPGAVVFTPEQLGIISSAAAVVLQQYTPAMIEERVHPLENALRNLTERQDEIEHHVAERLNAIEARQVIAPLGWKTAYAFIRELVGPERERFRYMTSYKHVQGSHDMGYFEYFCVTVTRERGESPQSYLVGERMRLHFPPDILEAAFTRFKDEIDAGRLGGQRRLHLAGLRR